jgi:IS30 family transposase
MKYHPLTREQRDAIYLGLQSGKSLSAIARQIEVHKSTVSRETLRAARAHRTGSKDHGVFRRLLRLPVALAF